MKRWVILGGVALATLVAACSAKTPAADNSAAAHHPRTGDQWPGEAGAAHACTTVVIMKPNRVVHRSGSCPVGTDSATQRTHNAAVDDAIRRLAPGEQTTVSTAVPAISAAGNP